MNYSSLIVCCVLLTACGPADKRSAVPTTPIDTVTFRTEPDSLVYDHPEAERIKADSTDPADVVAFAQTLTGIPYQYASCNPASGFDCSGFVYYVFDHFGIAVPRSSTGFTDLGQPVPTEKAAPGDLILFTGTDNSVRTVGHIGIVVTNSDSLRFIHASSGSAHGVTTSPLDEHYKGRLMKVIRVFRQR